MSACRQSMGRLFFNRQVESVIKTVAQLQINVQFQRMENKSLEISICYSRVHHKKKKKIHKKKTHTELKIKRVIIKQSRLKHLNDLRAIE